MTFRPANECFGCSRGLAIGFGLCFSAGALASTGTDTWAPGRALMVCLGIAFSVSIFFCYKNMRPADELITSDECLVVWTNGKQSKFAWDQVKKLMEHSGGESVDYYLHLQNWPMIPLGKGDEARWFLYECARLSGVRVTKKG